MTEQEAIAAVHKIIASQVGYTSRTDPNRPASAPPSKWSKYDQNSWHGYWCARGISTCVMQALGVEAGRAAIGRQNGMIVGWAATWLWREWFQGSTAYPGLKNARLGDILMMKFPSPSGNRASNPTNHVEWVTGGWTGSVPAIGFNSLAPGTAGSPTGGASVARQRRSGYIVGAYRPDWAAAAKLLGPPVALPTPKRYVPVGLTTRQVQAIVGVTPDGDYGPATKAAVTKHQTMLTELGLDPGPADGLWGARTTTAQEDYMTLQTDVAEIKAMLATITGPKQPTPRDLSIGLTRVNQRLDRTPTPATTAQVVAAVAAAPSVDAATLAPVVESAVKQAIGPYDLTLTRKEPVA